MNIARNMVLAEKEFKDFVLKYVKYIPSKTDDREDFLKEASTILHRLEEATNEYDRRTIPEGPGE